MRTLNRGPMKRKRSLKVKTPSIVRGKNESEISEGWGADFFGREFLEWTRDYLEMRGLPWTAYVHRCSP